MRLRKSWTRVRRASSSRVSSSICMVMASTQSNGTAPFPVAAASCRYNRRRF
ncbi:hypothetical protein PF005_g8616 [Phytophthora fragariae]|uniref:Uncharacterized protein n=2 Tax=Phytophthora TaxID=4783 RepID=A0A6A4DCY0_9STRA|nr:hypothetical protein PF003_g18523 [Phytophthora fragariae]KAE8992656.1 hypothetical protein PR001_g20876 [Phytophthora rubi]KAE8935631.1 hypothetical protein PF009_g14424 [Phytophthora fragariae]KAE9000747.1 hypothetical protein PF011_g14054 [Phytophthora fragariae]KAE9020707.1 hypothetical protein PR002_g12454 [Phytophthora rubi]